MEDIFESKLKIDKDVVGLDMNDSKDKFASVINKAKQAFNAKVTDLKKVDSDRGMFSLSKSVQEVAV